MEIVTAREVLDILKEDDKPEDDLIGGFEDEEDVFGENDDEVAVAFQDLLSKYGIDNIVVETEVDGGDVIISLEDGEGDYEVVVFGVDENGAYAMVAIDDSSEPTIIDLEPLNPAYDENGNLDLTDFSWITKSVLVTILSPGSIGKDESFDCEDIGDYDENGNWNELKKPAKRKMGDTVKSGKRSGKVIGFTAPKLVKGKKVKKPIIKWTGSLSGPQKAALAKAQRKSTTSAAKSKRIKTINKSKAMGLIKTAKRVQRVPAKNVQ